MKKKLLILLLCIFIISLPVYLLRYYNHLKTYWLLPNIFVGWIGIIEFRKPENRKVILMVVVPWLILVNFLITNRLDDLKPIVSATAYLKLEIKPTKIERPKPGRPWYGWINLPEKAKQSNLFLRAERPPALWGREGLIDAIWLDFAIIDKSPLIGKPLNYMDKIDGLELSLFAFRCEMLEVIDGECIITLNGKQRRKYTVPSQKSQYGIGIDLRQE